MSETVITVQGEFTTWYPAERATVNASVHTEGADRDAVFSRASETAEYLRELTVSQYDRESGPITWWSADTVRVWSERPWNNEGKQLPLVFHAALDLSAKFRDFAALAAWVEKAAAVEAISVNSLTWDLTDSTRSTATVEVRSRAVKDAVTKATIYAQSIGLGNVHATAIADPGMLGDATPGGGGGIGGPSPRMMKSMAAMDMGGRPALSFKPDEIEITAVVDARFIAR